MNPSTKIIDALVAEYDKADSTGCALGIIRDGELVYQCGYGMADIEKSEAIDPLKSRFYVASVSKQFTAACIFMLAAHGKLSLEDDVRIYFPELPDYGHEISLRHLMHYTGGLRDYLDLWWLAGRSFTGPLSNEDGMGLLLRQRQLDFEPGSKFVYCNSGYKLFAELVPRITGLTLRQFAERELFAPRGMRDTFFDDNNAAIEHRVVSYRSGEGGSFKAQAKEFTIVGSGGLVTTMGDLCCWDQNFYTAKVGGPEFIEQMQTRGQFNDGRQHSYAAGLFVRDYKGLGIVHHSGNMLGFNTFIGRFPEQRLSVILLGNLRTFNSWAKAGAIFDLYLAGQYRLRQFAGTYYSEELQVTYDFSPCAGDLFVRRGQGRLLQATTDTDQFQAQDTTFQFARGAAGQVVACVVSTGRAREIRFDKPLGIKRIRRTRRTASVLSARSRR